MDGNLTRCSAQSIGPERASLHHPLPLKEGERSGEHVCLSEHSGSLSITRPMYEESLEIAPPGFTTQYTHVPGRITLDEKP
jgi:hypothetical protein